MAHIDAIKKALEPLKLIADAFDNNELDEARPQWGDNPDEVTIELFSGREGKQLLTLQQCFDAREVWREL